MDQWIKVASIDALIDNHVSLYGICMDGQTCIVATSATTVSAMAAESFYDSCTIVPKDARPPASCDAT
jgi:hypothetical protein